MDKKYMINITRSTVVKLKNEDEAEAIANILINREADDFLGSLTYVTSDIQEIANAN